MQYFGSNIVEGVAESWLEAEMSWVEMGGAGWSWVEVSARFSNIVISDTPLEFFLDALFLLLVVILPELY